MTKRLYRVVRRTMDFVSCETSHRVLATYATEEAAQARVAAESSWGGTTEAVDHFIEVRKGHGKRRLT